LLDALVRQSLDEHQPLRPVMADESPNDPMLDAPGDAPPAAGRIVMVTELPRISGHDDQLIAVIKGRRHLAQLLDGHNVFLRPGMDFRRGVELE